MWLRCPQLGLASTARADLTPSLSLKLAALASVLQPNMDVSPEAGKLNTLQPSGCRLSGLSGRQGHRQTAAHPCSCMPKLCSPGSCMLRSQRMSTVTIEVGKHPGSGQAATTLV